MKKIHLQTKNNPHYQSHLQDAGLSILETELPSGTFIDDVLHILEIDSKTLSLLKTAFARNESPPDILCLTGKIDESLRSECIEMGISDILASPGGPLTARYASMLCREKPSQSRGAFIALENGGAYARILETISARFGYTLRFVETIDSLLNEVGIQPVELILINIGARNFDITEFIKKTYSCAPIKKYPLLAFKDMKEGLFVHEISSGLNRLTKQVLSREELLTFIINLLFRSAAQSLAMETKSLLTNENLAISGYPTLRQIFFSAGADLCDMTDIFRDPHFPRAREVLSSLDSLMLIAEGLRWMIPPKKKTATCGGGA